MELTILPCLLAAMMAERGKCARMRLARVKAQRIGRSGRRRRKKPPLCLRVDGMIEAIPDFFRSASIKVGIRRGSAARAKRMPSR